MLKQTHARLFLLNAPTTTMSVEFAFAEPPDTPGAQPSALVFKFQPVVLLMMDAETV